jgi:hypothetical protein
MRTVGVGILAAALLGTVVSLAAAQDAGFRDEPPGKVKSGASAGSGKDKARSKSDDKARPAAARPQERTARELKRHENALLRRMQVCDRWRQIAQETNDADLERQADELEELARAAYQRHAEHLGVAAAGEAGREPRPEPDTAAPVQKAAGANRPGQRKGEDKP